MMSRWKEVEEVDKFFYCVASYDLCLKYNNLGVSDLPKISEVKVTCDITNLCSRVGLLHSNMKGLAKVFYQRPIYRKFKVHSYEGATKGKVVAIFNLRGKRSRLFLNDFLKVIRYFLGKRFGKVRFSCDNQGGLNFLIKDLYLGVKPEYDLHESLVSSVYIRLNNLKRKGIGKVYYSAYGIS